MIVYLFVTLKSHDCNKMLQLSKSFHIALLMISYIQPFEDGNRRTARMLVNAVLAAGNCCPLSWRTVDETEYKKASVVFYETLSARYFKELFIEQCVFAQEEYFPLSAPG